MFSSVSPLYLSHVHTLSPSGPLVCVECVCVCLCLYLPVPVFLYLSVYLSVRPELSVFLCLCVCPFPCGNFSPCFTLILPL